MTENQELPAPSVNGNERTQEIGSFRIPLDAMRISFQYFIDGFRGWSQTERDRVSIDPILGSIGFQWEGNDPSPDDIPGCEMTIDYRTETMTGWMNSDSIQTVERDVRRMMEEHPELWVVVLRKKGSS